jgi:hypothetical protein
MSVKSRLMFAATACLLLSNCGLIGTALRLAPYALMFADGKSKTGGDKTLEMRGREVQDKDGRGILPAASSMGSQVAFNR